MMRGGCVLRRSGQMRGGLKHLPSMRVII